MRPWPARPSRATGLLLTLLLVAAIAVPARGQQGSGEPGKEEIQRRIQESQQRLEAIRAERERLRARMEELERRVSGRREALQNLERRIGTSASVVAELDVQLRARREEVDALTREVIRTRDELTAHRVELRQRLRRVYQRGPLGPVQVLLSARSFSDLIHRYKYLRLVTLYDRMLVEQVQRLEGRLEEQRGALQEELDRLQRLRAEKGRELRGLEQLEQEHRRTISRLQSQESRSESRLAELARSEEKLRGLLSELERMRREAEREAGRTTTSSLRTSDLGNLDWPVDGDVLYRFGPHREGSTTLHRDGIGIGAPVGTPVRAVESGRVAWSGERSLYGPTVIVSHGGGYYSVYLYLREARVSTGQEVAKGQVIGTVGGSGSREGPHVQFEIHVPGGDGSPRAVDPVKWLRERS